MPLLEPGDHRARRRRAADEHPLHPREIPLAGIRVEHAEDAEPDRRHARRPGDAFLHERVEQALRIEMRPRIDELRAEHRCEIRIAPRVRVEHRHDRQDRVALGDAEPHRVAGGDAERVQHRRAVRVQDALRQPGGAARVTHRCRFVLVELGIGPGVGIRGGEQAPRTSPRRRARARSCVRSTNCVEQRHEAPVDDHDACRRRGLRCTRDRSGAAAGSACAARIRRTGCRDRPRGAGVVPAERRDAVAALEAEPCEPDGQRTRAAALSAYVVRWKLRSGRRVTISLLAVVRLSAPEQGRAASTGSPSSGRSLLHLLHRDCALRGPPG